MSAIVTSESPRLSDEVIEMAARYGVASELSAVMAMTARLFPGAAISVEEDIDPEASENDGVAIVVRTACTEAGRLAAAHERWHHEIFDCCHTPVITVFRLGLEFVE